MSLGHGASIVRDGLVFHFDAANVKCYPGTGSTSTEMQQKITGTLLNTPTYSTNLNGYFSFSTNTSISFPNSTALDTNTPSVNVWARLNTTTQNGFLFEKGVVNTQYSVFFEGTTLVWRYIISGGILSEIGVTTATHINTSDWVNICTSLENGSQKIYINGNVVATGTTSVSALDTNSGGMRIGAHNSDGYFFNGDISCVNVYNKVLSELEVKQNFNALRGRYGI